MRVRRPPALCVEIGIRVYCYGVCEILSLGFVGDLESWTDKKICLVHETPMLQLIIP